MYLAYDLAKALIVKTALGVVRDHYDKLLSEEHLGKEDFDPDLMIFVGVKKLGEGQYVHTLNTDANMDREEIIEVLAQSMISLWQENYSDQVSRDDFLGFFEEKLDKSLEKAKNTLFH